MSDRTIISSIKIPIKVNYLRNNALLALFFIMASGGIIFIIEP